MLEVIKMTDKIFFNDKLRGDVREKGAADYVTRADIEISHYLHGSLKKLFPGTGFLSEEESAESGSFNNYWILDPIDGTTNFIYQNKLCALSLGYYKNKEPEAGIIYLPYEKELFWAQKGKGAFLNGNAICCSKETKLSECLGMFEYNPYYKEDYKEASDQAVKMYLHCKDVRTLGSAAAELAYVACGRADVLVNRYLKPWDYAAGAVIVSEAGGKVTDLSGNFDITKKLSHIAAANGAVHEKFLQMMKGGEDNA